MCQYGQGIVRGLLEEFDTDSLKGFAVWLPMMPNDSAEAAEAEATPFEGLQVVHVWDPERQLGDLYAKVLRLHSTVWDFYFLYAPGVRWEGNEPPHPTFWMHQLPAETGASRDLVLYPTRLSQEILNLLGSGVDPGHTSHADLGLQLHAKGLSNLLKERSQYSLEEIRQVVTDSKIEA